MASDSKETENDFLFGKRGMPLDALLGDAVNYIACYPEPYKNDLYKLLDELCESQFHEFNLSGLIKAHDLKDEKDYILNRDFIFRFIRVLHDYSTKPEFMLNFNCHKKGIWNEAWSNFRINFLDKPANFKYPRLAMMDFFSSFDANPYQPSKEHASVMISYIVNLSNALGTIKPKIDASVNEIKVNNAKQRNTDIQLEKKNVMSGGDGDGDGDVEDFNKFLVKMGLRDTNKLNDMYNAEYNAENNKNKPIKKQHDNSLDFDYKKFIESKRVEDLRNKVKLQLPLYGNDQIRAAINEAIDESNKQSTSDAVILVDVISKLEEVGISEQYKSQNPYEDSQLYTLLTNTLNTMKPLLEQRRDDKFLTKEQITTLKTHKTNLAKFISEINDPDYLKLRLSSDSAHNLTHGERAYDTISTNVEIFEVKNLYLKIYCVLPNSSFAKTDSKCEYENNRDLHILFNDDDNANHVDTYLKFKDMATLLENKINDEVRYRKYKFILTGKASGADLLFNMRPFLADTLIDKDVRLTLFQTNPIRYRQLKGAVRGGDELTPQTHGNPVDNILDKQLDNNPKLQIKYYAGLLCSQSTGPEWFEPNKHENISNSLESLRLGENVSRQPEFIAKEYKEEIKKLLHALQDSGYIENNPNISYGSYNINFSTESKIGLDSVSTTVRESHNSGESTKLYKLIDDNVLLEAIYDEESDGESDDDETHDDVNVDKVMSKMKKDTPYFKVPFLKEQITKLRRLKNRINKDANVSDQDDREELSGNAIDDNKSQHIYFENFFNQLHSFMEKDPDLMSNETSRIKDYVEDLSEIKNTIEDWEKTYNISVDDDDEIKNLKNKRVNDAKELIKFLDENNPDSNIKTKTKIGQMTSVAAGVTSDEQEESVQLNDDFNDLSKLLKKLDNVGVNEDEDKHEDKDEYADKNEFELKGIAHKKGLFPMGNRHNIIERLKNESQKQLGGTSSKVTLNDFKEKLLEILKNKYDTWPLLEKVENNKTLIRLYTYNQSEDDNVSWYSYSKYEYKLIPKPFSKPKKLDELLKVMTFSKQDKQIIFDNITTTINITNDKIMTSFEKFNSNFKIKRDNIIKHFNNDNNGFHAIHAGNESVKKTRINEAKTTLLEKFQETKNKLIDNLKFFPQIDELIKDILLTKQTARIEKQKKINDSYNEFKEKLENKLINSQLVLDAAKDNHEKRRIIPLVGWNTFINNVLTSELIDIDGTLELELRNNVTNWDGVSKNIKLLERKIETLKTTIKTNKIKHTISEGNIVDAVAIHTSTTFYDNISDKYIQKCGFQFVNHKELLKIIYSLKDGLAAIDDFAIVQLEHADFDLLSLLIYILFEYEKYIHKRYLNADCLGVVKPPEIMRAELNEIMETKKYRKRELNKEMISNFAIHTMDLKSRNPQEYFKLIEQGKNIMINPSIDCEPIERKLIKTFNNPIKAKQFLQNNKHILASKPELYKKMVTIAQNGKHRTTEKKMVNMIVKHGDPTDPDIKAIMNDKDNQKILEEHSDLNNPTLIIGRVSKLKQQTLDLMVEAEDMAGTVHLAESKNKNLKARKNLLMIKLNEIKAKILHKSGSVHEVEMNAHDIFRIMGIFVDFIQEAEESIKDEKDKASKDLSKKMAKETGYELKAYLSDFNARFEEKLSRRKIQSIKPRVDGSPPNGLPPEDKVLDKLDKLKNDMSSMESDIQKILKEL